MTTLDTSEATDKKKSRASTSPSRILKNPDLLEIVKKNNGYLDTIKETLGKEIESMEGRIQSLETEKESDKLYTTYESFLYYIQKHDGLLFDERSWKNLLGRNEYEEFEKIMTDMNARSDSMLNEKKQEEFKDLQKNIKFIDKEINDTDLMLTQTTSPETKKKIKDMRDTLEEQRIEKKKKLKNTLDLSPLQDFFERQKKLLEEQKKKKETELAALDDMVNKFLSLVKYIQERSQRPENIEYKKQIEEKIKEIDQIIEDDTKKLNEYNNNPDMKGVISSLIQEMEETKQKLISSSSIKTMETITSSLGKNVLDNLSITSPLLIQLKREYKIDNIKNPTINDMGDGWMNIKDEDGTQEYCVQTEKDKPDHIISMIFGNYKNGKEATLVKTIFNVNKKLLDQQQLTVSDSSVPGWIIVTDAEGKHFNCKVSDNIDGKIGDNVKSDYILHPGDPIVLQNTKGDRYIFAGGRIYHNDTCIVSSNITFAKKLEDSPYILYGYSGGNALWNTEKNTTESGLFDMNRFDLKTYKDPSSLNPTDAAFYQKLKENFATLPFDENKNGKITFAILDKANQAVRVVNPIEGETSLFETNRRDGNGDSKHILDITTGELVKKIQNITRHLDFNFCEERDGTEYIMVDGKLLGGRERKMGFNEPLPVDVCKIYKHKIGNNEGNTMIIFKKWGQTEYGPLHRLRRGNGVETSLSTTNECYATRYPDHFVVKESDGKFYVLDAVNDKIIKGPYDNYDSRLQELSTPKKGIFTGAKRLQITEKGLSS